MCIYVYLPLPDTRCLVPQTRYPQYHSSPVIPLAVIKCLDTQTNTGCPLPIEAAVPSSIIPDNLGQLQMDFYDIVASDFEEEPEVEQFTPEKCSSGLDLAALTGEQLKMLDPFRESYIYS